MVVVVRWGWARGEVVVGDGDLSWRRDSWANCSKWDMIGLASQRSPSELFEVTGLGWDGEERRWELGPVGVCELEWGCEGGLVVFPLLMGSTNNLLTNPPPTLPPWSDWSESGWVR